jgi:hypothetical protein
MDARRNEILVKARQQSLRKYLAWCKGAHADLQKYNPQKTPLFWFIWLVKGHDDMTAYLENPTEALKTVEIHLRRWIRMEYGEDAPQQRNPWRVWFNMVDEDAKAEFYETWQKIRYRPGHDPLEQAFEANQALRLALPQEIREKRPVATMSQQSSRDYEFFVGFAIHLQVAMGLRNILLPLKSVAGLMGVSIDTVSRYRKWAQEDGYLLEVRPHRFKPGGTRNRATEFRANPFACPGLWDRITTGHADEPTSANQGRSAKEWQDWIAQSKATPVQAGTNDTD